MFQKHILKSKRKCVDFNMKARLNGERLHPTDSMKYFGIKIDSKLNWKNHVENSA